MTVFKQLTSQLRLLVIAALTSCAPLLQAGNVFDVMDFGAVADGKTLDHTAINKAIDACVAKGGGQVYLPAGKYLCGSIRMKSNVEFELKSSDERLDIILEDVINDDIEDTKTVMLK